MKIFSEREITPPASYKKTERIRKVGMVVFFTCLWMASATVSYSQEKKISLKVTSGTLKEVCSEIERKSDYRIIFSDNVSEKMNNTVTLDAAEGTVEEILKILAEKAGVAYKIYGKQVVLLDAPADKALKKRGSKKKKNLSP